MGKKQKEPDLKKLELSKCLESEEFKMELERAQKISPSKKPYESKFQFKEKDLKKWIAAHFDKLKEKYGSFEKIRMIEKYGARKRYSTFQFDLANVEKVKGTLKDNEWEINFQVSDVQIHVLSPLKFKDVVLYNKVIRDSYFSRAMDKAKKYVGEILLNCVLRPGNSLNSV